MQLTNLMLVEFALKVLAMGARYWFGTFGVKATTSLYNAKKGQYPSHYTSARAAQYKKDIASGAMVTDCMGLIKWFFWSLGLTKATKYEDGFPDISANQCIASYCDKTGAIGSLPEVPGLVLWCKDHIGIYIGNGWAIEARGFAYGVVKTRVSERSWTKWGRIKAKYLTYVDGAALPDPDATGALGARELKLTTPLTVGEDVRTLQKLLINWNYSCGKWGADGEYGAATQAAVLAWQYDNGLPETGVMDADDYARVNALLNPEDEDDGDEGEGSGATEPAPPERYVTVTSGNTVNVRTAPLNSSMILGIAYLSESFEYADETSMDGWHKIHFGSGEGWISGKYTTLADAPVPMEGGPEPAEPTGLVLDLDQHSNLKDKRINWDKVLAACDFVILRCGVTRTETAPIGIGKDDDFAYVAKILNERGKPFWVYYYGKVKNPANARKEAEMAYKIANPYGPVGYYYDIEEERLTDECIAAFIGRLRELGVKKVGRYIAHHLYAKHKATTDLSDTDWIPRYGKNNGKYDPKYAPAYPCDLHQYTSVGKVAGMTDSTLDLNRLTGRKPLSWFLTK